MTHTRVGSDEPTQEVWVGATAETGSWSAYTGLTMAPFGALTANGWRLRTAGGYGEYHYRATFAEDGKPVRKTVQGAVSFAEALIGYHQQWGPLTVKAFAGVAAENHNLAPFDPMSEVFGYDVGVKGALETWYNFSDYAWASLDVSWTSVFESYSSRMRAGYRFGPDFSLGLEGGAFGNAGYDGARGGPFIRYTWSAGEISLSGGSSFDRSLEIGAYSTINALYRY